MRREAHPKYEAFPTEPNYRVKGVPGCKFKKLLDPNLKISVAEEVGNGRARGLPKQYCMTSSSVEEGAWWAGLTEIFFVVCVEQGLARVGRAPINRKGACGAGAGDVRSGSCRSPKYAFVDVVSSFCMLR